MKILLINSVCGVKSTGRICTDLAEVAQRLGHTVKIAYGRESVPEAYRKYAVRIGNDVNVKVHAGLARILDNAGFSSILATKKFLKWIDSYQPDLVHLHNIHGYYLHVGLLFQYLKNRNIPVVWSLHDCWSFTGHCGHFHSVGCDKWLTGCYACINKKDYPASVGLDNSKRNYKRKKALFTGVKNLTLAVPSMWLEETAKRSYLGAYPVARIPFGIDLNAFKPTGSDIRARYGLQEKRVVLGVATAWSKKKGIDDFANLAKSLDERYKIVLVGINEEWKGRLPEQILCLPRTNSVEELAQIYSMADVFFNPSLEETMGLTTVEALACGTPAIVYNQTAVPEIVDEKSGVVVPCSIDGFENAYQRATALYKEDIVARARAYDKWQRYEEYIRLYEECIEKE